jgi:hypothetical protein
MQEIINGAKYCVNRNGTCNGCKYYINDKCELLKDSEMVIKTIDRLSKPNINDFLSFVGKKYWRVFKRKSKAKGIINSISLISFEYLCGLINSNSQVGEIFNYEDKDLAESRLKELDNEEKKS